MPSNRRIADNDRHASDTPGISAEHQSRVHYCDEMMVARHIHDTIERHDFDARWSHIRHLYARLNMLGEGENSDRACVRDDGRKRNVHTEFFRKMFKLRDNQQNKESLESYSGKSRWRNNVTRKFKGVINKLDTFIASYETSKLSSQKTIHDEYVSKKTSRFIRLQSNLSNFSKEKSPTAKANVNLGSKMVSSRQIEKKNISKMDLSSTIISQSKDDQASIERYDNKITQFRKANTDLSSRMDPLIKVKSPIKWRVSPTYHLMHLSNWRSKHTNQTLNV